MVGRVRLKVRGPAGHDGHAAPRRDARPGRHALHRQPARGAGSRSTTRCKGGGGRGLRAALHLPRLPLRRGRGLARRADARQPSPASSCTPTCRVTGSFECSDPLLNQLQHNIHLGPEGQLPRRAHRLPAARRAPGLDGRRAGLRPHRRLQHGRGRLLHQVAGRPGRRPAAATAACRIVVPDVAERSDGTQAPAARRPGPTPARSARGRSTWLRRHAPPGAPVRRA